MISLRALVCLQFFLYFAVTAGQLVPADLGFPSDAVVTVPAPEIVEPEPEIEFNPADGGDAFIRRMLHVVFSQPEWRNFIVEVASQEQLSDPAFRAKWKVSDNEVNTLDNEPEEVQAKINRLMRTKKMKGLIALSSTKAELTDAKYRKKWSLGAATVKVMNSREDANFFHGPQWKEFMHIVGTKKDLSDARERANWLVSWLWSAFQKLGDVA